MRRFFCLALVAGYASLANDLAGSVVARKIPDRPPPFTNQFGMKFVWIPPGTFMMGSPQEEKERQSNEIRRKVTVSRSFFMGVHPVTQEQWQAVMGKNPSHFKGERDLPVETVSWDDCQAFLKRLRELDKRPYRLPTEAEWEYCCRAGSTTPYHFGETLSTDLANFNGSYPDGNGIKGVNREKTTPVGRFHANVWGLHDVHGNVFQWCQDWYGLGPQGDAVDPQGPDKGEFRVLRGGSWYSFPRYCRSASRIRAAPGYRDNLCGLRVCLFLE